MHSADEIDIESTLGLVRAAQKGDREALEELYRRYAPRVLLIARTRLRFTALKFADYEDMAQEALLRALKGLQGFDATSGGASVGAFRGWLANCVQTAILDHLKRTRRAARERPLPLKAGSESLYDSIFASPGSSPSDVARGHELAERLEEAFLDLPERYQEVIDRRVLCGMSYAEIARSMGFRNEASVRALLHRALRRLEEALKDYC